jgi:hypothetical protein
MQDSVNTGAISINNPKAISEGYKQALKEMKEEEEQQKREKEQQRREKIRAREELENLAKRQVADENWVNHLEELEKQKEIAKSKREEVFRWSIIGLIIGLIFVIITTLHYFDIITFLHTNASGMVDSDDAGYYTYSYGCGFVGLGIIYLSIKTILGIEDRREHWKNFKAIFSIDREIEARRGGIDQEGNPVTSIVTALIIVFISVVGLLMIIIAFLNPIMYPEDPVPEKLLIILGSFFFIIGLIGKWKYDKL